MRYLFTIAFLLTLCACGAGVAGKYSLDIAATKAAYANSDAAKKDPATAKSVEERIAGYQGELTLNADGTFRIDVRPSSTAPARERTGTYKLEGDKLSLTGSAEGESTTETKFGSLAGDVVTVHDAVGKPSLLFRRS